MVKNNRPIAVITTPEEFAYLSEAEENIILLEMALERLESSRGQAPISLDQAIEELDISKAEFDAVSDAEIEFE